MQGLTLPDAVLVRKSYEEKRRRRRARGEQQRPWKLKRMAVRAAGLGDEGGAERSLRLGDEGGVERSLRSPAIGAHWPPRAASLRAAAYASACDQAVFTGDGRPAPAPAGGGRRGGGGRGCAAPRPRRVGGRPAGGRYGAVPGGGCAPVPPALRACPPCLACLYRPEPAPGTHDTPPCRLRAACPTRPLSWRRAEQGPCSGSRARQRARPCPEFHPPGSHPSTLLLPPPPQELEEDPEMRARVALYRDPNFDPAAAAAATARQQAAMADTGERVQGPARQGLPPLPLLLPHGALLGVGCDAASGPRGGAGLKV